MRMGFGGWIATFAVIALAIVCYILGRSRIVSAPVSIVLLLVLLTSNVWLFPYISSVQVEQPKNTEP